MFSHSWLRLCCCVCLLCTWAQFESLAVVWNSQIDFKKYTNIQAILLHYLILMMNILMKECLPLLFIMICWKLFICIFLEWISLCFLGFLFYRFHSCKILYALADHNAANPALYKSIFLKLFLNWYTVSCHVHLSWLFQDLTTWMI